MVNCIANLIYLMCYDVFFLVEEKLHNFETVDGGMIVSSFPNRQISLSLFSLFTWRPVYYAQYGMLFIWLVVHSRIFCLNLSHRSTTRIEGSLWFTIFSLYCFLISTFLEGVLVSTVVFSILILIQIHVLVKII